MLRDAEQSAMRAAGVVRELMTYAGRGRTATRRVVAIGPLVEQTVEFCRTTFDRSIELEIETGAGTIADVDASQLEQAILNLLVNARDAVEVAAPERPKIVVRCEHVAATPELDGRSGDWVAIRVADNGIGMDDATLRRMFEPFFTTKAVGKGTGLGLATTQAIVRDHGGFAAVRSQLGAGTTFSLFVPARSAAAIEHGAEPHDPSPLWRTRDSAILVVDDDEQVRMATARVLKSAGFAVEIAETGERALALIGERAFDLVLLDVSMPGMSGAQTRRHVRERAPHLPVVFLTGYTFESEYGDIVLEKPLPAEELVARIDQILMIDR